MVIGLATLIAVVHSTTLDNSSIAYIAPLLIYGLGQGSLQAPLVNFILADVPRTTRARRPVWSRCCSNYPSHWESR